MVKITRESPFTDYVKILVEKQVCIEVLDFAQDQLSRITTFGDALDEYLHDDTKTAAWTIWLLRHLQEYFTPEILDEFITKIKDPMSALMLAESNPELKDKLESIYKNKLPEAEK